MRPPVVVTPSSASTSSASPSRDRAKNVKTKVNVNEINSQLNSSTNSSQELERANSVIAELRDRLKFFENQMLAPAVPASATVKPNNEDDVEESKDAHMQATQVEGPSQPHNNEASYVSQRSKTTALGQQTQEISSQAMREQIKFMSVKLEQKQSELEAKEMLVQQIELEKREAHRKHE